MKVTHKIQIGILFFAATLSQSHAAALVPIAVSGWNQDIVIGSGEALTGRTATIDLGVGGGGNTWYGVGRNPSALTTGLPVGPTNSVATPSDFTFELQPFTANNALLNGGLLTLASPTSMLRLGLIGSTGNGVADIIITVNYASGSPETFTSAGSINLDWAGTTFTDAAYKSQGRINVGTGTFDQVVTNRMTLFQSVYMLSNTSNVVSVNITDGGSGNNAIMAISGEELIPEPSAVVLVGISALGLFARRRR